MDPFAGAPWTCPPEEAGQRLDKFLQARMPGISRSRIQGWIEDGCFRSGDRVLTKRAQLRAGEEVALARAPELPPTTLVPEDIPFPVVYEDAHLLVVDKPKGMVVHPGNGTVTGTLANALAHRYGAEGLSDLNGPWRPGILHRLDKDTSGLMLVAKGNAAHAELARQLEARTMARTYRALAWGRFAREAGAVDLPVGRHTREPARMAVNPQGRRALTHYRVLDAFAFAAHLELKLETGRTHQIRVHLSHLGHAVVGDPLYGGRAMAIDRLEPLYRPPAHRLLALFPSQALHAWRLAFRHPSTGAAMEFESPPPAEFPQALELLAKYREIGA